MLFDDSIIGDAHAASFNDMDLSSLVGDSHLHDMTLQHGLAHHHATNFLFCDNDVPAVTVPNVKLSAFTPHASNEAHQTCFSEKDTTSKKNFKDDQEFQINLLVSTECFLGIATFLPIAFGGYHLYCLNKFRRAAVRDEFPTGMPVLVNENNKGRYGGNKDKDGASRGSRKQKGSQYGSGLSSGSGQRYQKKQ